MPPCWTPRRLLPILENREYTGCLVNFKTEKLSYKVKHSVENPPEKQVIFENHHEPIIDTQTWERVQELRKQRKRPNRYDEVGLFSGILFCADCGSVMYQQRYQTDKRKQDCYICGNYKKRTHETKMFLAQAKNITLGDMLDMWVEEELKPGSLSDGTVTAYINTVSRIKKHPIGKRKLKTVTSDHLQSYMDLLSFGGTDPDGKTVEALSKGSLGQYSAVLQNSFRFAVFPKRLITFNPMQYVVKRIKGDEYELFTEDGTGDLPAETPTISHEQYLALNELLKKKHNPALLPIQIAYFAGLRIGEVCGLTWQDIDLKEQCLTIRRSMRYDSVRKKTQIGPTKRKKIRTVDFCDTLAAILREAKKEQMLNSIKYGPLYSQNYYRIVKEKNRTYYEVYSLPRTETPPEGYTQVSFVCLRSDGAYEAPATVSSVCRYSRKKIGDMDDFHFHLLRHTYTTNLLSHGAAPKDVQELLGHSDVSTTMNIYAHATREAKRTSARLLDKVVGTA